MISLGKNKKEIIKTIFLSIVSATFMVGFGGLFSLITGYQAQEQQVVVQALVWLCDITLSYTIAWLFFRIGKTHIPYFSWLAWGLSVVICVVLVALITNSIEVAFISCFSFVVSISGNVYYLIKKKREPLKEGTNKSKRKSKRR